MPSRSSQKLRSARREPKKLSSDRRPHRRSINARSRNASSFNNSIPPLPPQVRMCEFAKLVTVIVERSPVGLPRNSGPSVSHESSMVTSPWASAMARMASQSGVLPMRLGMRSAFVRGVIISSMRDTSTQNVSSSASTSTGVSPARTMGAMSVENVSPQVTISSSGAKSSSSIARYSADEPELTMTPRDLPNSAATWRSMAMTRRPGHRPWGPDRNTSTTASISRSSWTLLE
ncbi:unannotated protein [freshwater metagenome]|uniref:Unannotated protein n=1 Tax=freshwater metagenome TaxID=449393 RepID=A0A6J7R1R8_9ZZZZ